jgi:hypothetical protein
MPAAIAALGLSRANTVVAAAAELACPDGKDPFCHTRPMTFRCSKSI